MTDSGVSPHEAQAFDDLEPWGYGEGLETPVTVYGVDVVVPLVAIGILMVRALRRRALVKRAELVERGADVPPQRPGDHVAKGRVLPVGQDATAVRVTVTQQATVRHSKGGWTTYWREVERRVHAGPFELQLADGSRLRVEPGNAPRLVDSLGSWENIDGARREASAKLERDEQAVVSGELASVNDASQGYRGGQTLVMRPKASDPMLISTQGLAASARESARRATRRALGLAFVAVLVQLIALPYHAAVWLGETRDATIVERIEVPARRKHPAEYFVRYQIVGEPKVFEDEVTIDDYVILPAGQAVPVRVSPLETTLGPHPTLHGLMGLIPAALLVVFSVFTVQRGLRATAWYERRLDEDERGRHPGAPGS